MSSIATKLVSNLSRHHQTFPLSPTVGQKRAFISAAAETEIPKFENMKQVLDYSAKNLDSMDAQMAGRLVGNVGFRLKFEEEPNALLSSDTVKALIKKIQEGASSCDGPQLAYYLAEMAKLKVSNTYPSPAMTHFGEEALARFQKGTPIDPIKFPYIAKSLTNLGVKSLTFANFVKAEAVKGLSLYNPAQCRALLTVMADLGLKEPEINRALFERIAEQIDDFKNEDVVQTLSVFQRIGMQHPATVRKCVELAVQHTQLFEIYQIQSILNSLCLLRAAQPRQAGILIESLQKRFAQIGVKLVTTLYNLTLINYNDMRMVSEMVSVCLSTPELSFSASLNMAYVICFYDLQDRKDALGSLLSSVFSKLSTPSRPLLAKLSEIIPSAEKEFGLKLNVPEELQIALKEYVANAPTSPACYNALELSHELTGKFAANFEKDVIVGPYKAHLVDKQQKIVMEFTSPTDITGPGLRKRHYQSLGYSYCSVRKHQISIAPERREVSLQHLQQALEGPLLRLGKLTSEEIETRRASVKQSRM